MKTVLRFGLGAATAAMALCAHAQTYYVPTYQITNNNNYAITDICMFWQAPASGDGPGMFWDGYDASGNGFTAAGLGATTSLSDLPKPVQPTGELLLGVYTEGAAHPDPGQQHVVLFMDSSVANQVNNIAWGTVFPNTDEDQLLNDLITVNNPNANWNGPLNDIFNFVGGDAQTIPTGDLPNGTSSAWITPAAPWQTTKGTIMMWSSGQQIGTFTTQVQTVPEPASYCALGLGGLVLLRRRKR